MKNYKKIVSFIAATALAAIALTMPSLAQEKVLGIVAFDLQHPFFVRMKEAGDIAAKDYDVRTTWQSAEGSLEKQVSIIENFINQGVDAILIDPIDKNAVVPVVKKALSAGIQVITMGNKVEGDGNHSTLYPDYDNMSMVARAVATSIGGKGEVALIVGSRGNFVSDTREKGFVDTIEKEFPDIKIVGIEPSNFDAANASNAVQTWLTTYPDLKAIACISDSLCLAADTIAATMGHDLIYGGYDGDGEMKSLIDDGKMVIDVLTGAYRVGYWNVAVGARLVKGEELPLDLFMPTFLISSKDTAEKLRAGGLDGDFIDSDRALIEAENYSAQFGPSVGSSDMSF